MMGYFKTIAISIEEAVAEELAKGFESFDEMVEVFKEIAFEYDVPVDNVWDIYHEADIDNR